MKKLNYLVVVDMQNDFLTGPLGNDHCRRTIEPVCGLIRNYLKSFIPPEKIKNAYIPEIPGKERRKNSPSKEGLLGVEGMSPQILEDCLRKAGATFVEEAPSIQSASFTKTDLFFWGLAGRPESGNKRKKLQARLGIPTNLSSNSLLEYLNRTISRSDLEQILDELEN